MAMTVILMGRLLLGCGWRLEHTAWSSASGGGALLSGLNTREPRKSGHAQSSGRMRQRLFTFRCKVTDGRRYSSVGENGRVHRFSDREICSASLADDIESVDVRKLKRSRWS